MAMTNCGYLVLVLFFFSVISILLLEVDGFQLGNEYRRRQQQVCVTVKSHKYPCNNDSLLIPIPPRRRRALLEGVITSIVGTLIPFGSSHADETTDNTKLIVPDDTVILKGTVTLPSDIDDFSPSSEASALYITCRPDKPDNVPLAILNGSRGKPPPVLSNPTFPLNFELSSPRDLTIEGASDGESRSLEYSKFWWKNDDLIVSARWDSDGVAATRSPDDLVGRGIWKNGESSVSVPLTGRGAFGKFATGAKK